MNISTSRVFLSYSNMLIYLKYLHCAVAVLVASHDKILLPQEHDVIDLWSLLISQYSYVLLFSSYFFCHSILNSNFTNQLTLIKMLMLQKSLNLNALSQIRMYQRWRRNIIYLSLNNATNQAESFSSVCIAVIYSKSAGILSIWKLWNWQ